MEETVNCPICCDDVSTLLDDKKEIRILDCEHLYCRQCLKNWVLTQLRNKTYPVKCPDPRCEHYLNFDGEAKNLVNSLLIKRAKKVENFAACPRKTCKGTIKMGKCNLCDITICNMCGEVSHKGPCNPDIKANYQFLKKETKKCPKCQVAINKEGGCNHIICRHCKTHFDWETLSMDPAIWNAPPPLSPFNQEDDFFMDDISILIRETINGQISIFSDIDNLPPEIIQDLLSAFF